MHTRHIGVISLPTFYQDFEARRRGDTDYKSATRDVAKLLGELKKEKVDGVLIDLRNNGGGSLAEAIDLTGLFIDKGPVVQVRNASGQVEEEEDPHPGMAWDGPLAVLVNRDSASASEIFAAAIQDYGRGVIIGEPTFGKGTVQNLVDLDQLAQQREAELRRAEDDHRAVLPHQRRLDAVARRDAGHQLPDHRRLRSEFGESSYDNALPWTSITPAHYQRRCRSEADRADAGRAPRRRASRDNARMAGVRRPISPTARKLRKRDDDLAERAGAPQGARRAGSQAQGAASQRLQPATAMRRPSRSNASSKMRIAKRQISHRTAGCRRKRPKHRRRRRWTLKASRARTTVCRPMSAACKQSWRRNKREKTAKDVVLTEAGAHPRRRSRTDQLQHELAARVLPHAAFGKDAVD